jgi:hypothetical protein
MVASSARVRTIPAASDGSSEGLVTRRPDDTSWEALAIFAAAERMLRMVVRDVLSGVVLMAYLTKFNSSSES